VLDEVLSGATDKTLYEVCYEEKRCLVTLDLDFSDVTRFPPQPTGGIAVIRVPRNPSLALLEQLVSQMLKMTERISIDGKLWIVERDRIRIHQSGEESNV
jgi:predicted nuclease of predicted toxin-antitoxin system